MKWTNTIENFKTLKIDLALTIVSPILTVFDVLKIIPSGIRDIQENVKDKEIIKKAHTIIDTEPREV